MCYFLGALMREPIPFPERGESLTITLEFVADVEPSVGHLQATQQRSLGRLFVPLAPLAQTPEPLHQHDDEPFQQFPLVLPG